MNEILLARQAVVIIASAIASYTDAKTGYIYDWLTIPLIIAGIALNVLEQEWTGIAIAGVVFAVGYVLYYTGKLGGGDVKLYAGIAMVLPFFRGEVFIISTALYSALSAVIVLSIFYLVKYAKKGIDVEYNKNGIMKGAALGIIILIYVYFLWSNSLASTAYIGMIAVPMIFGVLFVSFERGIRKEFFLKKISLKDMEEDEIIAFDFMDEKTAGKIKKGIKGVFERDEMKELEKSGVKEILVYRELPKFGPFILLGTVLAMTMPKISLLVLGGI